MYFLSILHSPYFPYSFVLCRVCISPPTKRYELEKCNNKKKLLHSSIQFSAFRLDETPTFRTFPYFPYSSVLCRFCVSPQRNDKKWKLQENGLAHSSVLFCTLFGISPKRNTYFLCFSVLFRTFPYSAVFAFRLNEITKNQNY